MITCICIYEIRIKTHNEIKSIPPGTIFESDNNTSVLALLEQRKIKVLSRSKIYFPLQQSPQCPQCLKNESYKGSPAADIDISKSAMSANIEDEKFPQRPLPPANESLAGWNKDMQGLIDWFQTAPRIRQPFHLVKHIHVCKPEKFYDSLERSIQAGPSGLMGRYGVLRDDLKKLREVVEENNFQ